MRTDLTSLSGDSDVMAPMPVDPLTGGNIAGPPSGGSCTVESWFDDAAGTHRSAAFAPGSVFSGPSFTTTFSGTAENTTTAANETGAGRFSWSGSMKLRAVQEY